MRDGGRFSFRTPRGNPFPAPIARPPPPEITGGLRARAGNSGNGSGRREIWRLKAAVGCSAAVI